MKRVLLIIASAFLFSISSCGSHKEDFQLVIVNASVFNTHSLQVEKNRSVFIKDGFIHNISETRPSDFALENAIDANERILTPSFIDVHNHLNYVFGDTLLITEPENFQSARTQITEQYMPYGVTVVRSAGGREAHIPMEQSWLEHHPDYIDYYPTGGALVSLNTHFYNHTYVPNSTDVISKIRRYHKLGIRHIKVYSLMSPDLLNAAIRTANELDMNIFGHIENKLVSIETAAELGLTNFEHVKTLFLEVIRKYESDGMDLSSLPPDDYENWRFREYELFNFIGAKDPTMVILIDLFKENQMSLTPTIHIYAQPIGLTNSEVRIPLHRDNELNWSGEKLDRAKRGYQELASVVYQLYENGVILNTGSDTYDPGKTILSEMLLLNELGIPMNEVLKIASLNSARSINLSRLYGSIEIGKKAHLILFDKDPLVNPANLLSNKTIIKDGFVWKKP